MHVVNVTVLLFPQYLKKQHELNARRLCSIAKHSPQGSVDPRGPIYSVNNSPPQGHLGNTGRCWTKQPVSPAFYPAAPWQPQPLNMLCSSTSQSHLAEPRQHRSAMSRSGHRLLEAPGRIPLSPLPVESTDQLGQMWTEEDGEDRQVRPWSPTWQHLLPRLLCQCDRRHAHTCRDQQREAGNCGMLGFRLED